MDKREFLFDNRRTRVKMCPCGRSNRDGKFAPFKGYDDKGFCHSCGEIFFPDEKKEDDSWKFPKNIPQPAKIIKYSPGITNETRDSSLKYYDQNNYAKYLTGNVFDSAEIS